MQDLIQKIEDWVDAQNVINGTKPIDQAMKLFSEFGKLADNAGKGRDCRGNIGSVFVVLTIIAKQENLNIKQAMHYSGISAGSLKHGVVHLAGCLECFVSTDGGQSSLMECLEGLDAVCWESNSRLVDCVQIALNNIQKEQVNNKD